MYTNLNNNALTETLCEQVILEQFVASSINVKDKYFMLQNNNIAEVNTNVTNCNGQIKIEVTKFNYSPMFNNLIT